MTFSWMSDFVPSSLFAMKFLTLAFGPLGTLPSTPRRIGICAPHDVHYRCQAAAKHHAIRMLSGPKAQYARSRRGLDGVRDRRHRHGAQALSLDPGNRPGKVLGCKRR